MRRPSLLLILIGAGLIGAACASPAVSTEEPTDNAPPTATQDQGGGADETPVAADGSEAAPVLADGPWTGGQGQVTVSGGVEWATDEPITTDVARTTDGTTKLAYNSDDTFVTIFIDPTGGVPFHVSVTAPTFNASGEEDCEVTYDRADDTGIEATFRCTVDEYHPLSADAPADPGEVIIEGSLTATR